MSRQRSGVRTVCNTITYHVIYVILSLVLFSCLVMDRSENTYSTAEIKNKQTNRFLVSFFVLLGSFSCNGILSVDGIDIRFIYYPTCSFRPKYNESEESNKTYARSDLHFQGELVTSFMCSVSTHTSARPPLARSLVQFLKSSPDHSTARLFSGSPFFFPCRRGRNTSLYTHKLMRMFHIIY